MGPSGSRVESPLTELPASVHLWIKSKVGGDWFTILEIPPRDFTLYTLRPLKWLRYLGFVIYGRKGVLYRCPGGSPVVDYDVEDVEDLLEHYYYFSERKSIFPRV
jgi:hypothetical protein